MNITEQTGFAGILNSSLLERMMANPKIVFFQRVHPSALEIIKSQAPAGFDFQVVSQNASEADKVAAAAEADYILLYPAELPEAAWRAAKNCRLGVVMSAGYDRLDLKLTGELGIPVANNGGANSRAVAEMAMLLMLSCLRKLPHRINNTRTGVWAKGIYGLDTYELAGKTVGIVGLGAIGKMVAQRLRGFEVKLQYYDPFRPTTDVEKQLDVSYVELEDLMRTSDIVTIHVPLYRSTRGLINEKRLSLMKPTAVLVNTSRGPIIDEKSLIATMQARKIFAAGLDVLEKEPPDPANPLLNMDNVIVTPHAAGPNYDTWFRRCESCFGNIVRVANGQPPTNLAAFID
jgi:phosphoglycerate dehydrogenase-like enzyme